VLVSGVLSSAPQQKTALGGRVVNGVTHEPVRGAIVTMRVPLEGPFSEREVGFLTGADGRFHFMDPPRTSVELSVTKSGWVRPAGHEEARVVDLANQTSSVDDLELALWPEARLEGHAFEPTGQPASRIDLSIHHDGKVVAIPAPRTDDEGHFSVGGLQPGRYDVDGLDPSGAVSLAVGQVRDDLVVRIAAARLTAAPPVTGTLLYEPEPIGSVWVSGVVVDPAGVPVRGARITAFMSSNGRGIAESVTADGRFQFPIWAPNIADFGGDVSLFAEPALHRRPPGETPRVGFEQMPEDVAPTRTFHVALGQRIENMNVTIGRGSAITGRVTDASGDPITADVQVVQLSHGMNGLTQAFVDSTSTDSAGRYRIAGLREGTYQILAQPADYPLELHAADASGVHRRITFLDTYFPSAQDLSAAFPVFLTSDSLITGIDVHVAATPVTSIEVRAVGSLSISDVRLAIRSVEDPDAPWRTLPWDTRRDDGIAVIDRIAPGRYAIAASANVTDPDNSRPSVLRGFVEVSSDGLTPQRATVRLEAGATLSGHVVFDGSSVVPRPRVFVRLTPFTISAAPPTWGAITQSDAAGEVTMTDIAPGEYRLESPGSTWLLRAATLAGRDVLDAAIDFSSGVDYGDLVLTYTDRAATIAGAVTSRGSSSARVLVFPTDRRFWTNANRVQVLTITAGTYESWPLLAGDYFVVAVESADTADLPRLLDWGASVATRVSVAEGGRRVQNLVAR
jgi:protocatechuate 3,4-dioxygenase beta subunit